MSEQQHTLTYEGILELFRETDRKFQETREQMKETDRKIHESAEQLKQTQREVGKLGSKIGDIIENMVRGKILKKFQALGYDVTGCSPNKFFEMDESGATGEVDLLLDDGPVGILIEVKTTLRTDDIRDHIERIKKYRRYIDRRGVDRKQHFIGAVAGAVVSDEVPQFAQSQGMYVIVQSGEAVEIVTPPEGFVAKEW
jgi:predicted AAA+ superfamily ATPase